MPSASEAFWGVFILGTLLFIVAPIVKAFRGAFKGDKDGLRQILVDGLPVYELVDPPEGVTETRFFTQEAAREHLRLNGSTTQ